MVESRGNMVMVADGNRFRVQMGLRVKLGEELGDLVMDYLPPTDWGQVARVQDVQSVREDLNSLQSDVKSLQSDVNSLQSDVKSLQTDVSSLQMVVQSIRMEVQLLKMELDALRRDVDRIDRTLKWFIGVNVAVFLGMYALQVQTLLLVSRL